jgi:hypothetical protein
MRRRCPHDPDPDLFGLGDGSAIYRQGRGAGNSAREHTARPRRAPRRLPPWARSHDDLANGSEVTVLFALRRDGSLLGRPRITHSNLTGDPNDQRLFVGAVVSAIDGCLPLDITPGLGGAIAGRPLVVRVVRGQWRVGI